MTLPHHSPLPFSLLFPSSSNFILPPPSYSLFPLSSFSAPLYCSTPYSSLLSPLPPIPALFPLSHIPFFFYLLFNLLSSCLLITLTSFPLLLLLFSSPSIFPPISFPLLFTHASLPHFLLFPSSLLICISLLLSVLLFLPHSCCLFPLPPCSMFLSFLFLLLSSLFYFIPVPSYYYFLVLFPSFSSFFLLSLFAFPLPPCLIFPHASSSSIPHVIPLLFFHLSLSLLLPLISLLFFSLLSSP